KKLKNETLSLKLRGKDWTSNSETVLKRYEQFHKAILQYKNEDVFELFMNIYTGIVDPHTNYFSPEDSDNFRISMSLSLEGIGAQLRSEDDYVTIVGIVPGGPADKSQKLKEGDRIVAVGQDDEGEFVDIVGWRTDEAVKLIRGDKGTTVRMLILPADANIDSKPVEIKLVREKIKLEDQAAQKDTVYIYKDTKLYTIGVVKVPAFYLDFEGKRKNDPDYKSTTKDVKRIIEEFKKEGIDGVIVDLRNNGGGSLLEAVELTGLFIDSGPVVQVKKSDGMIEVDRDIDNSITWNGPLLVMVNKNSASASEIFSAAIQDYGRGLIVGEQTYGKGTVQNLIDLSKFVPAEDDNIGQLKITVAKFYRITGGSTQHKGVVPDIEYPTRYSAEEVGESSLPSALPWDQIDPTKFKAVNNFSKSLSDLIKNHSERAKNNIEFQFLLEDIEEYNKNKDLQMVSLNEEKRIQERDEEDAQKKLRDEQRQQKLEINIDNVPEVNTKQTKKEDYLLQESGEILTDFIQLSKN
ncbi:MAG: carboxy terminal-processing peptidase, partial [Ignavibacteriales bacterium]|nr:carboxy terminal-processing peptidase [Ignavibacteriales bacterium]